MADHGPDDKNLLELPNGVQDERSRRRQRAAEVASDAQPDAAVPPLSKLVSRIPPPPRLPSVDGDRWVASAPPATESRAPVANASPVAKQTRRAATLQAWGAVLAALLSGALLLWSSVTPQTGKGVAAVRGTGGAPMPLTRVQTLVAEADALREHKQWAQAEARYVQALQAASDEPTALRGLCRTSLGRKDGERAVYWAKRLLLVQPGSADGNLLLGDAELLLGHRREALYAWQRARELGSQTAETRLAAQP